MGYERLVRPGHHFPAPQAECRAASDGYLTQRRLRPARLCANLPLMDVFSTPDLAAPIEELSPQADSRNAIFMAALLEEELQRLLLSSMPTISESSLHDCSMSMGRSTASLQRLIWRGL